MTAAMARASQPEEAGMSEDIAAALRAAALAGMNHAERDHAARHYGGEPGPGALAEAAEAVAAFHRERARQLRAAGFEATALHHDDLVQDIEEAARHE